MNSDFITTYRELLEWRPHTVRDRMKDIALRGLVFIDALTGADIKFLDRPRIQFLYLHHVFKDEEQQLRSLLNKLSQHFEFISYSDAVTKILTGQVDKPYICFSADDGLKNNLTAAAILNEYGAKACFFINPGLIGEADYGKIKTYCRDVLDFPVSEFLGWDDVCTLLKDGHEIGGHSMHHMNIAATNPDEISADMAETWNVLRQYCDLPKHFAFPYGRFFHFSEAGRKAVFDAGFISCASAERGCHINPDRPLQPDELCIRRDHVVLDWGVDQIFHFINSNARKAAAHNNLFPTLQ
ncbi:polysaccharide deacetylase family protein [Polluticoccus soli]|uniref:polysaccharide deacetylase family protein n=1 Tax=Polluticoccus soli TaxID=3034150 RepID=UPI0023E30D57|nr:polysaccharide deacetylase family protein [Flavipsychrobacter sp. JY13-12]